ncbi:hypothetical protein A8C32_10460 [Flavivirga aquatica]|uniref:Prepilin-type N-terminal cleavage/methylation domain-containing protein n=1 Tax=Flavivirga aquatica TaxID=1849968 RepID=A0A1E5TCS7_9FLAO|nr:hypothetical protein [Flavivirga aquatica]OEK09147.1 hypothetical protein A8C32_10460 [Flavivirga aquatica]
MKVEKLKSFTILETLLSLMLMGIVITITYTLFNVLGKQMSLFENENASELQYNLFNTTIINDIEKANDFNLVNDNLVLQYYDNSTIEYKVLDNNILRYHAIKTDTFKVNIIKHNFLQEDNANLLDKTFLLTLILLNDTINATYFLNKNKASVINDTYFEGAIENNLLKEGI